MKLDVMTAGLPLRDAQRLARDAAASGHAGLVITEANRTAYLTSAAVTLAAEIDVLTGIAVAFPRSPMVTAQVAWELAEASAGRFRLGLGTQVRAHVERRYSSDFDPPGPRMRDYLLAIRACFAAFRTGEALEHHGPFYELSLLSSMWSPGPITVPDPPIDLAAVNPWMLRLAGEVGDGVHVHPLNTTPYLTETVLPQLEAGAAKSGRSTRALEVIVPSFLVVGDHSEQSRWRELARAQVAFYGTTPNYGFIFDQLGRTGTTAELRRLQRAGQIDAMIAVIDEDLLRHFVVEGTWSTIADAIADRYAGIATRVVNYFGTIAWAEDPASLRRWEPVVRSLANIH